MCTLVLFPVIVVPEDESLQFYSIQPENSFETFFCQVGSIKSLRTLALTQNLDVRKGYCINARGSYTHHRCFCSFECDTHHRNGSAFPPFHMSCLHPNKPRLQAITHISCPCHSSTLQA